MATEHCSYHPHRSARWHCDHCVLDFCTGCMPDGDAERQTGNCPICSRRLRYSGAAGEVEPFWNRIGRFFLYPLAADPIIVILICTLVPVMLQPNLIGLLISLFLAMALLKYGYSVITHTSEGHMTPPPLAEAFAASEFGIIFRQIAVFFLMGVLIYTSFRLGGAWLGLPMIGFLILALPASVAQLTMDDSVTAAVNPLQLASIMARIGWPYMVLYVHLLLMMVAGSILQDFALNHFPLWMAQPLAGLISSYFVLIFCHMLGYVLFQYQDALGFSSDLQDEGPAPVVDRSKRLDADIDINLKDGRYDQVQLLLLQALKRQPTDDRRAAQLYKLISARGDDHALQEHHRKILPWLIRQQNGEALAGTLRSLRSANPDFQLQDPDLAFQSAQVLYNQGQYKLLFWLLKDFHKRFPDYPELARAYLLVARALANGMRQYDKAGQFLRFIHKNCSKHPIHGLIPGYLEQVKAGQPLDPEGASISSSS